MKPKKQLKDVLKDCSANSQLLKHATFVLIQGCQHSKECEESVLSHALRRHSLIVFCLLPQIFVLVFVLDIPSKQFTLGDELLVEFKSASPPPPPPLFLMEALISTIHT